MKNKSKAISLFLFPLLLSGCAAENPVLEQANDQKLPTMTRTMSKITDSNYSFDAGTGT